MTGNRNWNDGLGKTGETYPVGQDYLMRSVSRFLVETPDEYLQTLRSLGVKESRITRIRQYKTSILEQKVRTQAVEEALTGKQGTQIIRDYPQSQPPRLLDQVRQSLRLKHCSLKTEKSYVHYIRDFILFHTKLQSKV